MIGDWIKQERRARKWTQAELAAQSGISAGYIRQLEINERPNPGGDTLEKLAAAFGVTIEDVLHGARETRPESESPPLEELRALGWSEGELEDLAVDWAYYSVRERSDIVASAHKLYEGKQELERRAQEQRNFIHSLLRRRNRQS